MSSTVSGNSMDMEHSEHDHQSHHRMMMEDFKKRFWLSLVLTLPILFLSPLIADLLNYSSVIDFTGSMLLLWLLSTVVYLYGGKPFLKGFAEELRTKNPGMMTLIAIAITVAYVYSTAVVLGFEGSLFFWELATLIDIMLLGHWIEMRSILGASSALNELSKLLPSSAHLIDKSGETRDVDANTLKTGDKLLVKPGEKIPADGVVTKGLSYVNESILTGEALPVEKTVNSEVIGGSINADGALTIQVSSIGEDTFVNQVIKLVQEAQSSHSKTQDLANRAAKWLAVIGVSAGFITLFAWLLLSSEGSAFAIERAVTVMIITCPHALGLAIPLVVSVSTARAAKEGLLIRDRSAFEQARNVDIVVFDKTGTLTYGEFGVEKITLNNGYDEDEVLGLAASLEAYSEHPIAQAISKLSDSKSKVTDFKSLTGAGVSGVINGKLVRVLSPSHESVGTMELGRINVKQLSKGGQTVVLVVIDDEIGAAISLSDKVRGESILAVKELKSMGVQTYMLTGDNPVVAKRVAKEIKLDGYFANVKPGEKSAKIKEFQLAGHVVAMVGDGINDAPALAMSDVGIAIGAGTDVATETAGVILVRNDPRGVATTIKFAKATYGKMLQNLVWASGYNIIAIPLAAGVLYGAGVVISPALGAFLMSLSTVIVALNARKLDIKLDIPEDTNVSTN